MARGLRPESAAAIAYRKKLRGLRDRADELRASGQDEQAQAVDEQVNVLTATRREMRDATREEAAQAESGDERLRAVEKRLQAEQAGITDAEVIEVLRAVADKRFLKNFPGVPLDPKAAYRAYLERFAPDTDGGEQRFQAYASERQEYINPAIAKLESKVAPGQHPALQAATRFLYRREGEYLAVHVSDEVAAPTDKQKPLTDQLETFKFASPFRDRLASRAEAVAVGMNLGENSQLRNLSQTPDELTGWAMSRWSDTDSMIDRFRAAGNIQPPEQRSQKKPGPDALARLTREHLWLFQALRQLGTNSELRSLLPDLDTDQLDRFMEDQGYRVSQRHDLYVERRGREESQTVDVMEAELLKRRLEPVIREMRQAMEAERSREQAGKAEARRARLNEFGQQAMEYQRVSSRMHDLEEEIAGVDGELQQVTWYQLGLKGSLDARRAKLQTELTALATQHRTLEQVLSDYQDVVSDPVNAATTWMIRRTPDSPPQRRSA